MRHWILPTSYFHVVFSLPHELNAIILNNKKLMLNCLFAAASKTLLSLGQNELNGKLDFIAILHTWHQKLKDHLHLHDYFSEQLLIPIYRCRRAI